MKNYIGPGDVVTVEAPATTTSGDGVLVGVCFGVAIVDAGSGDDVQVQVVGVFELPKLSAQAWTAGDLIYWDDGNSRCTTVDTNVPIGFATEDAANPSSVGRVRLLGMQVGTAIT
jgi:predicted RecA/RadA family phage recombinase